MDGWMDGWIHGQSESLLHHTHSLTHILLIRNWQHRSPLTVGLWRGQRDDVASLLYTKYLYSIISFETNRIVFSMKCDERYYVTCSYVCMYVCICLLTIDCAFHSIPFYFSAAQVQCTVRHLPIDAIYHNLPSVVNVTTV